MSSPYPSYKDSGIEWLGQVPSDWLLLPLRSQFCELCEKNGELKSGDYLSLVAGRGVMPYAEKGDIGNKKPDDLEKCKIVHAGNFVINSMNFGIGAFGVSAYAGVCSPVYVVLKPYLQKSLRFLRWIFDNRGFRETAQSYGNGILAHRAAIGWDDLKVMMVGVPPVEEQVAIAAFLDRETAKIDALIEEQQRLITLLKEKRQAVISHAVTKGLDPHVSMKDSGIEWLGEMPAHWQVKPLKRVGVFNAGAGFPHEEQGVEGKELSFHKVNALGKAGSDGILPPSEDTITRDTAARLRAFVFPSGSIVFAKIGAALLLGRIRRINEPACLDNNMMGLVVSHHHNADFVRLLMTLVKFDLIANPGTVPSLNEGQIANVAFGFPPLREQQTIVEFLREQLARFDSLMAAAASSVELLNERRAALISAAVTGRIDVRGSAKVLSFPIERARARGLVATEIIERSANQPTFGRVKFQKIAFLAEAHVGISELAGSYTREAAGPLDRALIDEMESGARSIAGIEHEQPGGSGTTVSYRLGEQRGAHRQELADWLGADRTAKLDTLISDCASLTSKQAEAVATLYGVWNDALSEGASPTDEQIISGFLNDWHPKKRDKFRASDLPEWLGWMRRHDIVPTGSGPNTSTGRLFV